MRTVGTNVNSSMSDITQGDMEGENLAGGGNLMNLMGAMAGLMQQGGELPATSATGSYAVAGSEDAWTTHESNPVSSSGQGAAEALKARREAMGRRASTGDTLESIRLVGDTDDVQQRRLR